MYVLSKTCMLGIRLQTKSIMARNVGVGAGASAGEAQTGHHMAPPGPQE